LFYGLPWDPAYCGAFPRRRKERPIVAEMMRRSVRKGNASNVDVRSRPEFPKYVKAYSSEQKLVLDPHNEKKSLFRTRLMSPQRTVQSLGEFVDLVPPENPAYARDPFVSRNRNARGHLRRDSSHRAKPHNLELSATREFLPTSVLERRNTWKTRSPPSELLAASQAAPEQVSQ